MTGRLLVVDDDPDILEYLSLFLEDHGYEVRAARGAAQALAVLETYTPDAILLDIMMPGRSGLDLLVTLRRAPAHTATPLVVMTGNDRILQDDCQSYLGLRSGVRGPDGVLGKPLDPQVLLRVLAHVTGAPAPGTGPPATPPAFRT